MKYLINNKKMLLKYIGIIISNILIYILVSFYFKKYEHNFLIMFFLCAIFDYIIYIYKGKVKFNYLLDLLVCLIIGFILNFIIKDNTIYTTVLFSLFISNNFIFMRSRINDNFFRLMLQYLMIIIITIISMLINLFFRMYI